MKNLLLRCCTFTVMSLLLFTGKARSQNWKDPMADNTVSFYTLQAQFNHDMRFKMRELVHEQTLNSGNVYDSRNGNTGEAGEDNEVENESYFQYKRWEDYMGPRVFPSGDLSLPSTNWERFQDYLNNNPAAMQMYQYQQQYSAAHNSNGPVQVQSSTWAFAGPTGAPTGGGAGRVGFIRVDPTNSNNLWIGAPAGGLWKSTNGGASWSTNTDFLTVIGASDVAIDPTNTQNMYLATGDGDAGDTYSIGVLKSTDGGATWNTTGLTWTVNQGRIIRKLLINPTTPTTVMAFSNAGIWRTTDGGTNWTQVQNANAFTDAEFMPGTPNTVYACGTTFWRSTNGGATWTQVTTGLPANTSVDRLAIAVTAANTNLIYLIAGSAANDGFFGFYKSTNGGTSFTQVTVSSPSNLLGWASAGNDTGGQGWYDLVIDASPTNANEVCVGGVNIWRTTNGGTSWTLNAHWTGTGAPYVHADHHAMMYLNGTTMFEGCDGGIFKTTNNGGAWIDISANLCIAQIYRIGLSGQAGSPNYWITGHQDNGTNLKNGASYSQTMGGDGMDCFVDRTNNNVMYGEQYQGSLNRTTNGGGTWTAITTGLTGTAPWVTPWYQDPATANTIYCGRSNIWKSTNQGTSWTQLTALPGTGTIVDFKVAPSSNQTIYVVRSNAVYKTTNGGGAWTTITGTLPVGSAAISRVDVKPTDPNTAIVTFSGYSSGNKVFKTTNGGTSWTNISTGLPNLPCNCVRFDASSAIDAVYVGCDVGVYYMDNTFTSWQPYFTSLPNVPIDDLEIHAGTSKLRAATYGRGVWEVDIYNPGTLPPIAQFTASTYITCVGSPVNFTDQSSFTPTAWSWTFPSGTPATSTAQNPAGVVWNTPGTYTVTMSCSNSNGTSTPATHTVTVLGALTPPLVEGFQTATFVPANWTANNINNDGIYWNLSTTVGSASTQCARFDNYNNDCAGARDEMWAPRLNCSAYSTLSMTFDVAYARYDATYSDTLEVLYSLDCGSTWTTCYIKGGGPVAGTNLATAPDQTASIFVPTAAQWRNESVNLNACAGQSSVLIIFRNRGHYGQALYVDNINITGTAAALPNGNFTTSTTTACAGTPINFTDASSGAPTSWTWTFPSGTPASATTQNVSGVVWNTAGTYTVTHTATNASGTGTQTVVVTINANPTVTVTAGSSTICSGNSTTLTGSGATSYSWNPGSLPGSPVTVTPASTTTYTCTGTAANGCTATQTQTITVNPTPTVTVSASSTTICSGNSTTLTGSGATTYTWNPGALSGTSVTVSPASTTTYTCSGTTGGCSSTSTQLITVNPSPTVTVTASSSTICSGNSTTLTATGATSYTWMPGSLSGSSVTVSPTTTTTYTCTGTTGGCSSTTTKVITVNPTPTVTITAGSASICAGNSTTLTGAGASTYAWMPGSLSGTTVTVTPATTTTYTVTGTSAAGCANTATQTITVNPTPTVTISASSTTICSGSSTTLTGSGATTYTWNPGALSGTSVTVTPAATTTYTVTGSNGGCSATATQLITVNSSPTVTTTTTGGTICSGNSTSMTASGATSYTWMPGSLSGATVTVSPTTTTTYTVTGTGANGCTATATRTITVNPTPTVTASASSSSICTGNSVTLTGSGATTYTWNPGSLSGSPVTTTPASTTTYTVTGTSAGCSGAATVTVTVGAPPVVTASAASPSICAGSNTTLTGSGATTYTWMPGSLSGTTVTVTPASTTTYTVTGSTGPGCASTATVAVTVNPNPTVTTTATPAGNICQGASKTITASGASTYTWMPGSLSGNPVVVSPNVTTTYTVTGTSAAGCTGTATRTITVLPSPTVTATASSTSICTGSSVTLSSSGANTYNWQPGNHNGQPWTTNPASTTTYTVTGTAANGCTGTASVTVTVAPPPTVTASATSTSICNGGSSTLTGAGATTYTWNPGALTGTSVTVSPTTTTTYTVTGANGTCTNTATITITVNPNPTVTVSATSSTICSGGSTTLTGSGAFTYTWMPGSFSGSSITDAPATTTTYTVTGTSASGCSNTATQTITVNPTPTVTTSASATDICTGNSATITASGASTYNWMPGSMTGAAVTVTPAATTTYTVTGTDLGCTSNTTITINVNALPTVTASASNSAVCAGGMVTLTGNGATTYNWMPGSLSGSPVNDLPSSTTTYTVTGTDVNGCSNTGTVLVTVNTLPTVTASASSSSVCAGTTITLTGSGASTYSWMPISLTGSPVTDMPASSTTYTVTGTDANGCSNIDSVTVIVNPGPSITISGPTSICAGDSVTLTASGGVTYTWQPNGETTASVIEFPTASTTYTVTATDINGCAGSTTHSVTVNPLPATPTIIINGNTLTSSVTGVTYQWYVNGSPIIGATSQSYDVTTVAKAGSIYTVVVCDANGCCSPASAGVSPTGIDDPGASNVDFISVSPNPNNGEFILSFHINSKDDYVLEIHDVLGQIVYSEDLDDFSGDYSKQINLSNYGRGMYTIRLKNGDKQTVIKTITY